MSGLKKRLHIRRALYFRGRETARCLPSRASRVRARLRPRESTLVAATFDSRFLDALPERLIGDCADDADPLDVALAALGVELIAPHRRGRKRLTTQDGRPLRRSRRRWKVERLFAWLGTFRRLVVRYERHALNDLGFVQLGCILILLRQAL